MTSSKQHASSKSKLQTPPEHDPTTLAPLASSYNDQIRPLLDAVDRLRQLNVMKEGIQLPTIVVVGDQSSGKSSVLESLAGISLPRGQGICTRVPLIMRLQHHPTISDPSLTLEYNDKCIPTTEADISDAITAATDEIAGSGKEISNIPLTLVVKKNGVPDLTMVDLPGITRVPVHGQPENIYEQIQEIIMEFITPKESIILNVLSATVDFPTCESIRMSQRVDKTGERTLAVVTKSDKAPEGLLEKVTADDVNIGLGYVCVRNRIGDESYEDARKKEASLFSSHPLLSRIDKAIVGVPVLAQKLVQIQASGIARCLPDIVKKINQKLSENLSELNEMPQSLSSVSDAMRALMHMLSASKETLRKILVRGEFEDFPDEPHLHCTARLANMLDEYAKALPSQCPDSGGLFLTEEISILQECKGIALPHFLPRAAFSVLLKRKIKEIEYVPVEFISKVWAYVEDVVLRIVMIKSDNYPQLQSCTRRAVQNLMDNIRTGSINHVQVLVEMERNSNYTANPDYSRTWASFMEQQDAFMKAIEDHSTPTKLTLKVYGDVDVAHLRDKVALAEQAFDMRMRLAAYWRSVVVRMVDGLALHLLHGVRNLVEDELERVVLEELVGPGKGGVEKMLEETPSTARKRDRLKQRIQLLKASNEVVGNIMDRFVIGGEQ